MNIRIVDIVTTVEATAILGSYLLYLQGTYQTRIHPSYN